MKLSSLIPLLLALTAPTVLRAQSPDAPRRDPNPADGRAREVKPEDRKPEDRRRQNEQANPQPGTPAAPNRDNRSAGNPGEPRRDGKPGEVRRQIEDLHRAGKHDEAARMIHQFREGWMHHGPMRPPIDPAQGEKVRHLMEAVGHLRAAGLNDVADAVDQQARQVREDLERRQRESFAHPGPFQPGQPGQQPGQRGGHQPGQSSDSGKELRELRDQVQKIAHEVEKLREDLKKAPVGPAR